MEENEGTEVVLLPCHGCGISFLARAVAGEHECPDCGALATLVEIPEGYSGNGVDNLRLPF